MFNMGYYVLYTVMWWCHQKAASSGLTSSSVRTIRMQSPKSLSTSLTLLAVKVFASFPCVVIFLSLYASSKYCIHRICSVALSDPGSRDMKRTKTAAESCLACTKSGCHDVTRRILRLTTAMGLSCPLVDRLFSLAGNDTWVWGEVDHWPSNRDVHSGCHDVTRKTLRLLATAMGLSCPLLDCLFCLAGNDTWVWGEVDRWPSDRDVHDTPVHLNLADVGGVHTNTSVFDNLTYWFATHSGACCNKPWRDVSWYGTPGDELCFSCVRIKWHPLPDEAYWAWRHRKRWRLSQWYW